MSTVRLNRKCSKAFGISSDIFGNVRKSLEKRWKSLEVARMFLEILVMTRQNSHPFDSEKVDRYTINNSTFNIPLTPTLLPALALPSRAFDVRHSRG